MCEWYNDSSVYISLFVKVPTPWLQMFVSPAVWAIAIAYFCNGFGFYVILTCLPTYYKDVHNLGTSEVCDCMWFYFIVMNFHLLFWLSWLITLCTVCAEGLCDWSPLCIIIMCINYVYNYNMSQNIDHLASCWSKNLAHAAFFSHSDIGNVTVNCLFTPGQALLMYLFAYACLLLLGHVVSEVRVSGGAFLNHPCIDARIYVTALQYSTVHWYSQCSVRTGYVMWNSSC